MTKTQGEWSSLFVLLSVMQANDAAKDAARVAIQAIIDADPEAGNVADLQAVVTSLSTTDQLVNPFAEVLRRLAPWRETFYMRDVATLFGDRVSR